MYPQYNQITRPGDLVYEDYNHDNKIDDSDKQIVGSLIPRYTYGLTLNFGWKGINLSAQFQGVGKADAYISGAYTQPCVSGGTFQRGHLDNWTPDNPGAKYPRLSYTSDLNKKPSTFWMADASYCRLKNLTVGYTLPRQWTRKALIESLRIYFTGENLFTWSGIRSDYIDPEMAATNGNLRLYPWQRTYMFGVDVTF